jgi:pimeloyl-ACP methyl ester carboxylesterase
MLNNVNRFWRLLIVVCAFFVASLGHAYPGVFPQSVFQNLDYGLYWFGNDDNYQKAIPGHSNAYYSANKPTIVYIHGWQNGSSVNQNRETFNRSDSGGPNVDLAYAWRQAGYNVGILYWNQFADEGEVKDAEAKVWSANGPRQMRWRDHNGVYRSGPGKSAGQLMFESLRDNMSDYSGNRLILAGHSLGNQMAIVVAKKLKDGISAGNTNSKLKPKRVALLDPFYSNGSKSYLSGKWTGEEARNYVDQLKNWGVIFEAYRSSSVSNTFLVGDENKGLLNKTAFLELKPWYFSSWQQAEKHGAAVWHYLWSFDFSVPGIKSSSDQGLSASTSDSRVTALMNGSKRLIHDLGAYTKSPGDDRHKYGNRL